MPTHSQGKILLFQIIKRKYEKGETIGSYHVAHSTDKKKYDPKAI